MTAVPRRTQWPPRDCANGLLGPQYAAPLFRIVSGAISSELALPFLPLPLSGTFKSRVYDFELLDVCSTYVNCHLLTVCLCKLNV